MTWRKKSVNWVGGFGRRTKSVEKWIDSDPLRKEWWGKKYPDEEPGKHKHLLGFVGADPSCRVIKEVKCLDCDTVLQRRE